jgi:hypothetical protein
MVSINHKSLWRNANIHDGDHHHQSATSKNDSPYEDSSLPQGHFKIVDATTFPDISLPDGEFLSKYGNQPLLIRG